MENTLLVALSRQISLERQVDVIANNVANTNTSGFKAETPVFEEYLKSGAHEDNFVGRDRRVSFVQDRATFHDFSAGSTTRTGAPLDVAINGKGFFAIQSRGGTERYTRDGGFQVNAQGQLVTLSGDQVVGTNGPITFQPTDHDITISEDGTITVLEGTTTNADSIRGKLKLVSFDNPQKLLKEGGNTFSAPAGVTAQADTTSHVNQGFLEKSNVNAISEMTRLMGASSAYQQLSQLMQQQNDLRKNAIQVLADIQS